MRTNQLRWLPCVCTLALLVACRGDGNQEEIGQETETGDGDPGDGDGDPGDGDGDGDPGDGDGEPGDGDGEPGDGDGEPGDGDGEPGDGDGEPGDGDGEPGDGDGEPGDGDGDPTGDGDGEPANCNDIEAQYETLVSSPESTSCESNADCHLVDGHCFMGLGGCWYVVNDTVTQADLDALAGQYQGNDCFGPICGCLPPPGAVECVGGMCEPA